VRAVPALLAAKACFEQVGRGGRQGFSGLVGFSPLQGVMRKPIANAFHFPTSEFRALIPSKARDVGALKEVLVIPCVRIRFWFAGVQSQRTDGQESGE
jgi:hypothetical protein